MGVQVVNLGRLHDPPGIHHVDPVGDVGESINNTLYQQIADQRQAADPGTEVSPTGTDGPLLESVLDGYRGVKGDAAQVAQPIQINVGN